MRKKLYLSFTVLLSFLSAHASESVREEQEYSVKTATCIRNVSTATLDAADKCIKTMGPGLELFIKIADFISKFQSPSDAK